MPASIARTFLGPEGDGPALPGAPPARGAVWVGVYDPAGTQLAATRAQTHNLGGEPFVDALIAAAGSLGYQAAGAIRTTPDGEVEFDVEPRATH